MTNDVSGDLPRPASGAWMARARARLPGGVNSPVRAFRAVGGEPVVFAAAEGAWLTDVDGRRYVDFVGSWGPMILGHGHPAVRAALADQIGRGVSFGAPSPPEIELAEAVARLMPGVERLRMVNSGTEAVMSAARLARAATGRERIVKFEGGYHGHADFFLSRAGSAATTLGLPDSPGVPGAAAALTLHARYNDLASLDALLAVHAPEVAAILVEPVAGNMGVIPPAPGFLEGLRRRATAAGALLIFDEVITGFRLAPGGAQELYGVRPDLTTLGKILGGGLPAAAYGGRADLMRLVAPEGPVYQAGTLSGNPLAMRAGLAALRELEPPSDIYARLEALGARAQAALETAAARRGLPVSVARTGSMFTPFFRPAPPRDWDEARECDTARYARFFHAALRRGVYPPPSQFEAWFLSAAHTDAILDMALESLCEALEESFS